MAIINILYIFLNGDLMVIDGDLMVNNGILMDFTLW